MWAKAEPMTRDEVRQAIVMTGAQICATAGVSENTVRRWMSAGVLPSVKIGGRIFFPAQGFLELMEGGSDEVVA